MGAYPWEIDAREVVFEKEDDREIVLGAFAKSTLYKAVYHGRYVALKEVKAQKQWAENPNHPELIEFLKETHITHKLRHQNIGTVVGAIIKRASNQKYAMVFEFIPGYDGAVPNSISTLAQYMAKSPLAREPGASLDISRYSLLMPAQHSMRIYGFISHAPRIRDIAAGLSYLHTCKPMIIHGDISVL